MNLADKLNEKKYKHVNADGETHYYSLMEMHMMFGTGVVKVEWKPDLPNKGTDADPMIITGKEDYTI